MRRSSLPGKLAVALATAGLGLTVLTAAPAQAATTGVLPTQTTVTPSVTQAAYGTPVTLSSTVSLLGTGLVLIPTGTITYTAVNNAGTQTLGTASLAGCVLAPCTASLTTSALGVGANTITASYSGNGPIIISSGSIGGNGSSNTTVLVAPSSATTNVFVTKPPSAPQNLVVAPGDAKNTLTWSAPADPGSSPVTTYTVNRKVGAGSYSFLATVNAPTTSYVDTTAANGTSYTYLVAANNSAGASGPSNAASGTPQASVTAPTAPVLTATGQVGVIRLAWSSASNGGSTISEYRLYRRLTGSGNPFVLIAEDLPTGDYQDTTVIIGMSYDYRADAVNGVGASPLSNIAAATATALGGTNTNDTEACGSGSACSSSSVSGVDPATGNATDGQINVESSSSPHTATIAVGGPKLTGCTPDVLVGLSVTFNDTSTDAFKSVKYTLNGPDAQAWYNGNPVVTGEGELCLGLGSQWFHGQGYPVTWVPADGLWEGRVVGCANNGAYSLGGGHYSQPCATQTTFFSGPNVIKIEFVVKLPPGDGKIGGGH